MIAARLFIIVATYILFCEGLLWTVGSVGWRGIRLHLPLLDDISEVNGGSIHYEIDPDRETVGTLEIEEDEAVDEFHSLGYLNKPIASHQASPAVARR